ncbi:hypothetical protein EOM81_10815, partial [bacterium]|nr:hypothetical protein [bacterium]
EVVGSDAFPLIRIDIEKNRKSILSDTVGKNGKGKPKYESHLQRYTRESMGISTAAPKYDEEGNLPKGFRFNQFLLGERYLFIYIDLPVDCSALDNKLKKDCFQANSETDSKFAGIINNELTKFMAGQNPIVSAKYEKKLFIYKKELADSLVSDVSENKDLEVRREYETEINKRKSPLETEFKREKDDISVNIRKINESKLTKEEKEEKIGQLRKILADSELSFASKIDSVKNDVDLKSFYVSRNTRLIEKKEKSLAIEMQAELDSIKKDRKSQLDVQYKGQIVSEKETQKAIIEKQYNIDKADKIEKETVRRYQIYFRPSDITDKINDIKKSIDSIEPNFLTYDNRAEKAKIERQEKALNSLLGGYVKNPFLPAYLFAPETLSQATHAAQKDPEWCLESLNDRQKLAVKRALASESLFLLQGPPGTGKTQVIAEITAQFTKQGKKVLISSETHKAIDNVFDRLPKIPEIRPLRLIPSQNGKETNYSPEKLVDNLYMNISGNLEKQVGRFEHFEDTKATFDSEMKNLRQEYDRLLRLKKDNAKIESERSHLVETINRLNMELEQVRAELTSVKETIELYRRTVKYIESYRFGNEGVIEKFIEFFRTKAEALLVSFPCFESVGIDKIGDLMKANVGAVRDELTKFLSEDKLVDLKNRQQKLRSILQGLRDPETDDAPDENNIKYAEYKEHQNELITVVSEIKEVQNNSSFDISSSIVFSLVPAITNNKTLLKQLPENLTAFRIKLQFVISEIKKEIESETSRYTIEETNIIEKISDKQLEIS